MIQTFIIIFRKLHWPIILWVQCIYTDVRTDIGCYWQFCITIVPTDQYSAHKFDIYYCIFACSRNIPGILMAHTTSSVLETNHIARRTVDRRMFLPFSKNASVKENTIFASLSKRFRHLTRAEEVVITRLRIGHTKATKSHFLPENHRLLGSIVARLLPLNTYSWNVVLQQSRDEYYTVDSLRTLFETIPEACIIEFLREAGFFYRIWKAIYPVQPFIQISHQLTTYNNIICTDTQSLIPVEPLNMTSILTFGSLCEMWCLCCFAKNIPCDGVLYITWKCAILFIRVLM